MTRGIMARNLERGCGNIGCIERRFGQLFRERDGDAPGAGAHICDAQARSARDLAPPIAQLA